MKKTYTLLTLLLLPLLLGSCNNFLDIVPVGQVIPKKTAEYRATLNSGYAAYPTLHRQLLSMRGMLLQPIRDTDPFGIGMTFDEWSTYRTVYTWADSDKSGGFAATYPYDSFYRVIFYANSIILNEGEIEPDGTEEIQQVVAEAYALRALAYFDLVNLYAPKYTPESKSAPAVPINVEINTEQTFPRSTLEEVYTLILSDLHEALERIQVPRWSNETKRYRLSREAILALAARVHLYRSEWQKALTYAEEALTIDKNLEDLNAPEAKLPTDYRSAEAIFHNERLLNEVGRSWSTIHESAQGIYQEGDLRSTTFFVKDWTGLLPTKGGRKDGNASSIHRSEVYLIAAEAAARLSKDNAARSYLATLVRHRLTPEAYTHWEARTASLQGQALTDEVLIERQRELIYEGHDFLDYKRTTQPALTKVIDGKTYTLSQGDPRYILPIPDAAKHVNPYL